MNRCSIRRSWLAALAATAVSAPVLAVDKPNILVILGDDVGMWNISAYHQAIMALHEGARSGLIAYAGNAHRTQSAQTILHTQPMLTTRGNRNHIRSGIGGLHA